MGVLHAGGKCGIEAASRTQDAGRAEHARPPPANWPDPARPINRSGYFAMTATDRRNRLPLDVGQIVRKVTPQAPQLGPRMLIDQLSQLRAQQLVSVPGSAVPQHRAGFAPGNHSSWIELLFQSAHLPERSGPCHGLELRCIEVYVHETRDLPDDTRGVYAQVLICQKQHVRLIAHAPVTGQVRCPGTRGQIARQVQFHPVTDARHQRSEQQRPNEMVPRHDDVLGIAHHHEVTCVRRMRHQPLLQVRLDDPQSGRRAAHG